MYYSDPGLALYIEKLEKYPPFTGEEDRTAEPTELILRSLRWVIKIAGHYAYGTDLLKDYIQEGNIGLIEAAESYCPDKGPFIPWATLHIRSRIRAARRRYVLVATDSEDDLINLEAPDNADDLALHYSARHMDNVCSDRQKKVLEMRLNSFTQKEIASILGVSYQAVQQLEKSALKKMTRGVK